MIVVGGFVVVVTGVDISMVVVTGVEISMVVVTA